MPGHREGGCGCRERDGEVDAAGEHHERLAGGDHAERGGDEERRRELVPGDERLSGLVAVDEVREHEQEHEDADEDDDGVVHEKPLDGSQPVLAIECLGDGGHDRVFLVSNPPMMTTRMINTPW